VLRSTSWGTAWNTTWAEPPPVVMVAVWARMPDRMAGPPPESACSGPVRPVTASKPPSVLIVAWPLIPVADRGPPPVSAVSAPVRLARVTGPPPDSTNPLATPDTATGPPMLVTLAETVDGTVTEKLTLQSLVAHSGSARVRRPPETESCTTGGPTALS
jgi:hypothetical protein